MVTLRLASEPFLFLFMLCHGAHLSLLPQLTISKICTKAFNATFCRSPAKRTVIEIDVHIYKKSAEWDIAIFASAYVPAVFTILPVGAMSDLVCRKKILILPAVLAFIQNLVYFLCAKFNDSHVAFLAVGASIPSIFGDIQGAVMLSYAYLASVSSAQHDRTVRMAYLEGSIFLGQGLGSYISGLLVEYVNFVAAFALTLSTAFVNILFVVFILPPVSPVPVSKDEEQEASDSPTSNAYIQFVQKIQQAVLALWDFIKSHIVSPDPLILPLLISAFLVISAILGEDTIITLFLKYQPLSLNAEQLGVYFLLLYCVRGSGVTCLAFGLSKWLNLSDYTLTIIGLLSLIATHVSLSFASTILMLYCFTLFSIALPLAMSTIRAMLTKLVPEEEHGTILSCVGIITLVGGSVMNFVSNGIFRATANIFPGFSIIILSLSSLAALSIFCCFKSINSVEKDNADRENHIELEPLID